MAFLATFLQCIVLGLVIIANSEVRELLDKAPRLSIRIVIWILPSDTVFVNSIKISANTETAMLSMRDQRADSSSAHWTFVRSLG